MDGMIPFPFAYPLVRLTRRHAPEYDAAWEGYRPWLRDEFEYRCVYCLRRERWIGRFANFDIDHIVSRASGGAAFDYRNLAYACHQCNVRKIDNPVPHPEDFAYGKCLEVDAEGSIRALNREGRLLLRSVRLDAPEITRLRNDLLHDLRNLARYEPERFRERMSEPEDLNDLKSLHPTKNSKPESWRSSAHARKVNSK